MNPNKDNNGLFITAVFILALVLFCFMKYCNKPQTIIHNELSKVESLKTEISALKDSIIYYQKLTLKADSTKNVLLSDIKALKAKQVVYVNQIKIMQPDEACEYLTAKLDNNKPKVSLIQTNGSINALLSQPQLTEVCLRVMNEGYLNDLTDKLDSTLSVSLLENNLIKAQIKLKDRVIGVQDSTIFELEKESCLYLDRLDRANKKVKNRTELAKWGFGAAVLGWVAFIVK